MAVATPPDQAMVAAQVVEQIAPEEADLLQELLKPPSWTERLRGSSVGFGTSLSVEVVAPYVILGVAWVSTVISSELRSQVEKRLKKTTRSLLGADVADSQPPLPSRILSLQDEDLRADLVKYITAMGMKRKKAEVLADAIIARAGRLVK